MSHKAQVDPLILLILLIHTTAYKLTVLSLVQWNLPPGFSSFIAEGEPAVQSGTMTTATTLSFVTLDVFTSTRYTGNPLAIVEVPQKTALTQDQKQRIAREFNLSETVFLHEQTAQDSEDESVRIDIFTPQAELPFAGHPTVGTANYLLRRLQDDGHSGRNSNKVKALQAKAGRFGITLNPAVVGGGVQIAVAHDVHIHSAPFAGTAFAQHPVVSIVKGMTFILAQLPDLDALGAATRSLIDPAETYSACSALDPGWREGLVVTYFFVDTGTTTTGDDGGVRTLRVRCQGSREDPATGSAASALTSYLSLQHGRAGRYRYALTQGVEMGQRSEIFVDVAVKDAAPSSPAGVEIDQVLLSGSAVQVMQGSLTVPES